MPAGPLLVVFTGPSGAGKDSLLQQIRSLGRPYYFAITATTRPPRSGEADGVDYYFLSPAEFERLVREGELLEHAVVYGHQYGVPRAPVRKALAQGKDVLFRTDVQGARYIKQTVPGAVTIFIAPPAQKELERRIHARGGLTEQQTDLRLEEAPAEMAAAGEFHYTVINDDLARCASEIEEVLARERARPGREAVVLE